MYKKRPQGWAKHMDFLLLDLAVVLCSFALAYRIRHGTWDFLQSSLYRNVIVLLVLVHFMGTFFLDSHKNILKRGYRKELRSVAELSLFDALALALYFFITKTGGDFSRQVFLTFFFIALAAFYAERIAWKKRLMLRNPYFTNHLLVVTHNSIAEPVVKRTIENSFGKYEVMGVALTDSGGADSRKEILGVPVVRITDGLPDHIREQWIDDALFCFSKGTEIPVELLDSCVEMGITVHTSLDFLTERSNECIVEKFAGCAVVTESLRMASARQMFLKRMIDLLGASIGLALTVPLTVIVGPLIYLSDPGPIFFVQPRIGKNGRVFKLYKFRSMYQNAEARKHELLEKNMMDGYMFKMDDDPRILGSGPDGKRRGLGWFLRKYSLDEFPQFWNVLRGELSLVGTRPPLLDEWKQYEARHRARMSIQPGITGLWQISGRNEVTDFDKVIALDREYINHWSIGLDMRIILKTLRVVLSGSGK